MNDNPIHILTNLCDKVLLKFAIDGKVFKHFFAVLTGNEYNLIRLDAVK